MESRPVLEDINRNPITVLAQMLPGGSNNSKARWSIFGSLRLREEVDLVANRRSADIYWRRVLR